VNNCFELCRGEGDTTSCYTSCTSRLLWTGDVNKEVFVCDPPYKTCSSIASNTCCNPYNPTASPDGNGCPDGGVCYLLPNKKSDNSQTVCEYAAGASRDSCTYSRDCAPKSVCVPPGKCKRICAPQYPCTTAGVSCTYLGAQYGYCES
jgi:hypothetical protein